MDSIFRHRARIFPLILFSILLVFLAITSAYALIIPPDPFESTDRFALLSQAPDGSITLVQARVKAPGPDPLGAGKLWALLQYKLPPSTGPGKFYSAASKPVSVQGLSNTSTLIEFDFSNEPIPPEAYHRGKRGTKNRRGLLCHFRYHRAFSSSPDQWRLRWRPEGIECIGQA